MHLICTNIFSTVLCFYLKPILSRLIVLVINLSKSLVQSPKAQQNQRMLHMLGMYINLSLLE